jgi:hypothetical protein
MKGCGAGAGGARSERGERRRGPRPSKRKRPPVPAPSAGTLSSSRGVSRTRWNSPLCSSRCMRSRAPAPRLPRHSANTRDTPVVRSSSSSTSEPMKPVAPGRGGTGRAVRLPAGSAALAPTPSGRRARRRGRPLCAVRRAPTANRLAGAREPHQGARAGATGPWWPQARAGGPRARRGALPRPQGGSETRAPPAPARTREEHGGALELVLH